MSTLRATLNEVHDPQARSQVCDKVLRELPEWFGIETAIIDYVHDVSDMSFCSAAVDGEPIGFVALKDHNPSTSEIHVMGILREYHRRGIGKQLVSWCQQRCQQSGREYLTVKTLDESRVNQDYASTRQFYTSVGFRPLEVFADLWGAENPCLMMVKHVCCFASPPTAPQAS